VHLHSLEFAGVLRWYGDMPFRPEVCQNNDKESGRPGRRAKVVSMVQRAVCGLSVEERGRPYCSRFRIAWPAVANTPVARRRWAAVWMGPNSSRASPSRNPFVAEEWGR